MSEIFNLVFIPFAWLLRSLYFLFNSYGVAIILFCLITKILLFPLSLKGKKSMVKMNALSAQQQKLQKQYGKDKARLNIEVQKLYEKEKVNPLGGCLWSLLPLPILIVLYGVIQRPLHYMMSLTSDEINQLSNFLFGNVVSSSGTGEIKIAEELFHHFQEAVAALPALAGKLFSLDFTFLGINLSAIPQWNPMRFDTFSWNNIGLFLIPIVSAVLAFISMRVSAKTNGGSSSTDNPVANNKTMLLMMPLVSLWIGFTLPAALGIYWIANNVFTMAQEVLAGKLLEKDYRAAAIEREERERLEKEEEKELKRQAAEAKAKASAENKKRQAERKVSSEMLANSRIGIRAYARGRAYDPDRYSGVTPYRDPDATENEADVNAAPAVEKMEPVKTKIGETAVNAIAAEQATGTQTPAAATEEILPAAPVEADQFDSQDYEPESEESEEDGEK